MEYGLWSIKCLFIQPDYASVNTHTHTQTHTNTRTQFLYTVVSLVVNNKMNTHDNDNVLNRLLLFNNNVWGL